MNSLTPVVPTRILLAGALALVALLVAGFWNTPAHGEGHETEPENPGLTPQGDPAECTLTGNDAEVRGYLLTEVIKPRSNLSRYHGAAFIEWNIVHNSDEEEAGLMGTTDRLPSHFLVQRSDDGGGETGTWTTLATVNNEPDRYAAEIEQWKEETEAILGRDLTDDEVAWELQTRLDTVRERGRQLSYYDTTITWPPRYPGSIYHYRVLVVYENQTATGLPCSLTANIEAPVVVADPTPTTCAQFSPRVPDLRGHFNPRSGVNANGYFVAWRGVNTFATPQELTDYRLSTNDLRGGDEDNVVVPRFVVQRSDGVGEDPYFETVSLQANDLRGRAQRYTDANARADTAYTYRLIAVYGEDCGVVFTLDTIDPPALTCGTVSATEERDIRRALQPRRSQVARGVLVTWNDFGAGNRFVGYAPDGAPVSLPNSFALQRQSVPAGGTYEADDASRYVTLAVYDSNADRAKFRHADATALPGYTHYYRVVVDYSSDDTACGVTTRPTNALRTTVNANALIGAPSATSQGVRLQIQQEYWTTQTAVTRATSENGAYRVVGSLIRQDGATRTFIDRTAPQGTVCYKIVRFGPPGSQPHTSAAVCIDNPHALN